MEKNAAEVKMAQQGKAEVMEAKAAVSTEAKTAAEDKAEEKKTQQEVILQYREYEVNMETVTERVKAHYVAKGNAEDSIESLQIYVKPEEFTAYYVINDGFCGKVNLF